jgi:hypothetical protein
VLSTPVGNAIIVEKGVERAERDKGAVLQRFRFPTIKDEEEER